MWTRCLGNKQTIKVGPHSHQNHHLCSVLHCTLLEIVSLYEFQSHSQVCDCVRWNHQIKSSCQFLTGCVYVSRNKNTKQFKNVQNIYPPRGVKKKLSQSHIWWWWCSPRQQGDSSFHHGAHRPWGPPMIQTFGHSDASKIPKSGWTLPWNAP